MVLSNREIKIVMITSGQPSLNPRLVKEADTLADAGYTVTVLYAYWNHWGTQHDQQLLKEKKWKAVRLGGDPLEKRLHWLFSRVLHKISSFLLQKIGNHFWLADLAIARGSYFLIKGAKEYKADLYIAHNLGALPAVAKTAAFYKKPYGFDAEDFHRQEVSDDMNSFHFKISRYLEDRYLPAASYLTASSPLIAGRYASLYKRPITVVLNVFPKKKQEKEHPFNKEEPLKLFWFSQTIGAQRGLEKVIETLCTLKAYHMELHLLGDLPAGPFKKYLWSEAALHGLHISVYPPVPPDEIAVFASRFDIGLAIETESVLNRDICLTNKIFTYLQAGIAIIASDTSAQQALLFQYPSIGKLYRKQNVRELANLLIDYHKNRIALQNAKEAAFKLGDTTLNWQAEGIKILELVKETLAAYGKN